MLHEVFQAVQQQEAVKQFTASSGGLNRWSNNNNWNPTGTPQTGDRLEVYTFGSSLNDLNNLTLESIRTDFGTINGVGGGSLSANEFAVGIQNASLYRFGIGTLNIQQGYVGAASTGTFEQSSGKVTASPFLSIGDAPNTHGRYSIDGGTLSASELDVGYYGNGTFNQTGGQVQVANGFLFAYLEGSTAVSEFENGTFITNFAVIGNRGSGLFVQTGGTHNNLGFIGIAETGLGSSAYYLNNGTLTSPQISINFSGTGQGTFEQNGGYLNTDYFFVGAGGISKITSGSTIFGTLEVDGSLDITNRIISVADTQYIREDAQAGHLFSSLGIIGYNDTTVESTLGGDFNLTRSVDLADFTIIASNFGGAGLWKNGDANYDGQVGLADFTILASNFGGSYQNRGFPEPSVGLILGCSLLARRRYGRNNSF